MAADKHVAFAARCREMERACTEAVDWLDDNRELVSNRYAGLRRSLKVNAVEARQLAAASERPMSIGIFGPSQVGKSFLMGGMLRSRPAGEETPANVADATIDVVFGEPANGIKRDFLKEINPTGGRETTGVVTRFTTRAQSVPDGYPVVLRMLREIDVVKILANSYVFDLPDDARTLTEEELVALFAEAESAASEKSVDALVAEDVYELEQYFSNSLSRHPLTRDFGEYFWSRAETLLPRLTRQARVRVLSVLWGGRAEFDGLYLELKSALDAIGSSVWLYAKLDAIEDRRPGHTILHVKTLIDGISGADRGGDMAEVRTDSGAVVSLRKPVITALCAELRLTLQDTPREFLDYTDFLDFPGARQRLNSRYDKLTETNELGDPLGECFLRGKVATLFENYVADLELNSLIFCHTPADLKVNELPELLGQWIHRTHGATPQSRTGRPISLFYCVTWSDGLLAESVGQTDLVETLSNKLGVLEKFSYLFNEWEVGKTFGNCFLIRNPSGNKVEGYYVYGKQSTPEFYFEEAFQPGKRARLDEYAEAFATTDVAQQFFADPWRSWREMISLNDGGISHLLGELEPVTNPNLKYDQLLPRAEQLREQSALLLRQYLVTDDVEQRLLERTTRIRGVLKTLSGDSTGIPGFIAQLYIADEFVRKLYVEYARGRFSSESSEEGGGAALDLDAILGTAPSQETPAERARSFGDVVVTHWIESLERRVHGDTLTRAYAIEQDELIATVREYGSAAERIGLARRIDEAVEEAESFITGIDDVHERVASSVAMRVNDLVNFVGAEDFTPAEALTEDGFPALAEKASETVPDRRTFVRSWLRGVYQMTEANARFSSGREVDVAQNRRLAVVISAFDWQIDGDRAK